MSRALSLEFAVQIIDTFNEMRRCNVRSLASKLLFAMSQKSQPNKAIHLNRLKVA